ncbi:MAG: DUF718 domain-containing protein [SAR86 cluster bacterium]|jgi:hypothetical protein|nr:MAG: DUF718 domain-containing protein [SAR86 cluster bacterium]|tara:strand:- start:78 stop:368 length:291 start_codon:yes stop_codon:yes gene_type:complete
MNKFSNVVRFQVKEGFDSDFIDAMDNGPEFLGQEYSFVVKTGTNEYIAVGIWQSEESLINARAEMIAFLDTIREMLIEMPETGVTDPRSGPIVVDG